VVWSAAPLIAAGEAPVASSLAETEAVPITSRIAAGDSPVGHLP